MTDPGAPGPPASGASRTRVKVCGLTRREDARLAADEGADYLGVVLAPGSPRRLEPERAREVVADAGAIPVAVLVDPDPEEAVRAARTVGAGVVQLHGREAPSVVSAIREAGPWEVWKGIPVRGPDDVRGALERWGDVVDGLLLDGWHPELRGGTGRRFPPEAADGLRERLAPGVKLVAAGGLTPQTIGELVCRLRPDVVDVSSGVEARPGIKDPDRIRAFLQNVRTPE